MAVDPLRGAGDPQARVAGAQTHAFFEQHARMVYGLCRSLLRDPDDADDATQATFISAYTSLLAGNHVHQPAAWLATIARNECTARAQARMREPLPLLDADLGHEQGPEAEHERRAAVEQLQQAIAELPERQREAVVLRDLYGLQYAEVGAALGMSVASVESLLFRARRSLRISLKPLASGALTVPIAVREGIAQALPTFATARAAGGGAASGAIGLGLLAKFAGGPVAVKAVAGVAAAVAVGSMAVAGVEHAERRHPSHVRQAVESQVAAAGAVHVVGGRAAVSRVGIAARGGVGRPDDAIPDVRSGRQSRKGSEDKRPAVRDGADNVGAGAAHSVAGDDAGASGHSGHSGHSGEGERRNGSVGSHGGEGSDGSGSRENVLAAGKPHSGGSGRDREDGAGAGSGTDPDPAEAAGDSTSREGPEHGEDAAGSGEAQPDSAEPESDGNGHGSPRESGDSSAPPPA